ncbi:hypothetical protein NHP164001_14410 [Helicobacter trogontum]|uniref:Uncharacterized protein n=1 Tax=Helicobacter trogontum TaxID=50960 RepID=A0ABQ0D518_9HELI
MQVGYIELNDFTNTLSHLFKAKFTMICFIGVLRLVLIFLKLYRHLIIFKSLYIHNPLGTY